MHDFEQIKTHPSYARLPLTVREVLRMAFNDPNLDLLAALRGVSLVRLAPLWTSSWTH
jgi:hypothetical protein